MRPMLEPDRNPASTSSPPLASAPPPKSLPRSNPVVPVAGRPELPGLLSPAPRTLCGTSAGSTVSAPRSRSPLQSSAQWVLVEEDKSAARNFPPPHLKETLRCEAFVVPLPSLEVEAALAGAALGLEEALGLGASSAGERSSSSRSSKSKPAAFLWAGFLAAMGAKPGSC